MKKTLLFFLLTFSIFGGIQAQEVTIGNGTSSDYDIAFYPYYEDSWWESIYLSSEIGIQGLITSVALQSGSGPGLQCNDVRIYLGTRNSGSYSSTSDWTPASALTLVYSSTATLGSSNGWETYTLQNPFMYDGSSNLVVVFAKHASDYSEDATYYYSSTDNYQSLYRYMDDDPTYAQHPGSNSGSRGFYRPNLKLTLTPSANYCGAVNGIQVTGITTNEATISWNTPLNPNSYIVQVKTANQTWEDLTVDTYTTTDTFLTVTGLNPSTTYNVRIANDCVDDTSNYTLYSFGTVCAPIANLPIMEDFDSYTHTSNVQTGNNNLPHCWDALNTGSSYTSYPYVYYSTNNANSGSYSLRFYTGSNNQYADQYAFLPALDISTVSIQDLFLSFKMRRNANNTPFTLVVGVTSGTDISTFTAVDTLTVSNNTYTYKEVNFSNYTGSGDRIVIKASKPSSGNNRGYIDDIVLDYLNACRMVSDVTISNITTTEANISWQTHGTESAWLIEYREAGDNVWQTENANTNPYLLSNLNAATTYQIRVSADCSSEISEASAIATFSTENCDTSSQCDYTFILSDDLGDGWDGAILSVQQNGVTIATMTIDDDYSNTVHITLCDNISTSLVWTEGDFDDECSFTVTNPFGETIYTSGSLSGGTLFSFTPHCTPPTCPTPTAITVSNIGNTSVNVSWTAGGTETDWNLEYKEASSSNWTNIPLTSTTYTITGLTAGTNYDVRVQADCGGGDLSDWRESTFRTNLCEVSEQCTYTIYLTGEYDDSWEDNSVTIMQNGIAIATIVNNDYSATVSVSLCNGVSTSLVFNEGGYYADECTMILYAPDGSQIFSQSDMSYYTTYTFTTNCSGSTPLPACDAPTNIIATNITYNAADISWTAGDSETAWNVQYKQTSATDWGSIHLVTSTSYHITGLTAETSYQARVQAICSDTTSDWSTYASFSTLAAPAQPCPEPTGLTVTPAITSATVTWTPGGDETLWVVQYKLQSAPQWQDATVQQPSFLIEGLTAESTYDVRVKAVCAADNMSEPVNTTFTTLPVGIDNITLANSISLMPNPAVNYIELRVNSNVNVKEAVVYNAFGQMIQTIQLSENRARIDLSEMASGMYFVRVNGDNATATKKFIKK